MIFRVRISESHTFVVNVEAGSREELYDIIDGDGFDPYAMPQSDRREGDWEADVLGADGEESALR